MNRLQAPPVTITRRQLVGRSAVGIGTAALAAMLGGPKCAAAFVIEKTPPHFTARAKRVIYLFMHGGPSQIDLFDYKPDLRARHGEELPASVRGSQRLTGMTSGQKTLPVAASLFSFRQHGQSGAWLRLQC
jgi:hypothetical protein